MQISDAQCGHNLGLSPRLRRRLDIASSKQAGQLLLNHRQQHSRRDDNRGRIANAPQAAEALFTPKPQTNEPSVSYTAPSTEPPALTPRVLAILSPAPVRYEEVISPSDPAPLTTRE